MKKANRKEMVYKAEHLETPIILEEGEIKGIKWMVINMGMHPCSYIGVPKGHPLYGKRYDCKQLDTFRVHGGLSFASNDLFFLEDKEKYWWFGWDYAHAGDQIGSEKGFVQIEGRKWKTIELSQLAIYAVLELNNMPVRKSILVKIIESFSNVMKHLGVK